MKLLLTLIICSALAIADENPENQEGFRFDEEGNVLENDESERPSKMSELKNKLEKPLDFKKLVASKVIVDKNEDSQNIPQKSININSDGDNNKPEQKAGGGDMESEQVKLQGNAKAKAELKMLRKLHNELLETDRPERKMRLRKMIMKKVDILEDLMKKIRNSDGEIIPDRDMESPDYSYQPPGGKEESTSTPNAGDKTTSPDQTTMPSNENDTMTTEPTDDGKETSPPEEETPEPGSQEEASSSTTTTTSTTSMPAESEETSPKPDDDNGNGGYKGYQGDKEKDAIEEVKDNVEDENDMTFYPWEHPGCKDSNKEACHDFKPFCSILGIVAYRKCQKTCKLCVSDKPKFKVVKAKLKTLSSKARLILTQMNPDSPSFMTVCIAKEPEFDLNQTASAVIHSYGDVSDDGGTCQSFGSHYNPFGTVHGRPEDSSKHAGDLGRLDFGSVPEDWPEGVEKCDDEQELGAYGMFEHVSLYGDFSPINKPVVIYGGSAPLHGFSASDVLACGRLRENGHY